MNQHDPADLDDDGEFDAIDIVILEEGQDSAPPPNRKTGCCWAVIVTGAAFAGAAFTISKLMS
jgi:hypothetical protein